MTAVTTRGLIRRHYRPAAVIACTAVTLIVGVLSGGVLSIDRWFFDVSLLAHHQLGISQRSGSDPVAVIAIDERSLESPELRDIPRAFLGPHFAEVLDATFSSGAKLVAFDLLFTYDTHRINKEWDAPFRSALQRYASRVVLARSARASPVGRIGAWIPEDAVGYLELPLEGGVSRRVPSGYLTTDGKRVETLSSVILKRIHAVMPSEIILSPAWHLESIPTYALIDVLRCARADAALPASIFDQKVVLIGTTLPEEDRLFPPSRFISAPSPSPKAQSNDGTACALERLGASNVDSRSVPGVFVHAAAVEAALKRALTTQAAPWLVQLISAVMAALVSILSTRYAPGVVGGLVIATVLGLAALSMGLLAGYYWLPISSSVVAAFIALGLSWPARYLVEERRRTVLQRAFGYYLAPSIVERLSSAETLPALGGEEREVTVMFADLSGFTELSGRVTPQELVRQTNRALAAIAEEIDREGGYVDKFIGDAVMALWGAPTELQRHGERAVKAALAIVERISLQLGRPDGKFSGGFRVKIGIATGVAIVGNMGGRSRLSYTAIGEIVNLAARFESVPSDYGCSIVVGESTAQAISDAYVPCELDRVIVKGKKEPVSIYEPFVRSADVDRYVAGYSKALAAYRQRHFEEAAVVWRSVDYPGRSKVLRANMDSKAALVPNLVMALRAEHFASAPPPPEWQGEWVRTTK